MGNLLELRRASPGDIELLTPQEVDGLTAGLLVARGTPACPTRFSEWVLANGASLGVEWASEIGRHFR